jgi:hypothetical protein
MSAKVLVLEDVIAMLPRLGVSSVAQSEKANAWDVLNAAEPHRYRVGIHGLATHSRMLVNSCLFSGFSRRSRVPAGRAAKASLVGANTVNGPADFRV